jgi:ActR/RegA family two-component response regulator
VRPGNVRDLINLMRRYNVEGSLPPLEERCHWKGRLDEVLARHGGNVTATARELGR